MKQNNHTGKFHTKRSLVIYFLKGSLRYFILSIVFASIVSLADLMNPKIIEYTVDSVIGDQPLAAPEFVRKLADAAGGTGFLREHLYLIALLVLGIALLGAVCRYLFMLFDSLGAETFVQKTRDSLFAHIVRLPYAWHSENHTGDIIQRCTSDVETIKLFISEQLMSLFRVVLLIVLSLWFMMRIHVGLALAEALFIPVMVLSSVFFHNKVGAAFEKVDREEGKLSSIAQENLTGVRVVRAFGREVFEQERFMRQNAGYTNLWYHLQFILAAFWTSGNIYATVRNLVVTVMGVVFCVQGSLTAGGFIAFLSYNALISLPVRGLGRVITEMSKAEISIDRLRYIMNAEEEQDDVPADSFGTPRVQGATGMAAAFENASVSEGSTVSVNAKEGGEKNYDSCFRGDIVFSHVSFTYPGRDHEILHDVSFTVPAGKTVGILGSTGSGKTTLLSLLNRLYELPEEQNAGSITIGSTDIREIPRSELRRQIGMVLQEPYLFSRSLAENIGIACENVTQAELDRAASIACLDETIEHMSRGYETFVGERGVTLSGGQRQRAAIAQMLVRRTPVMIFDDALSAVDAETDARIRQKMQEQIDDSTVLLVSHRITTLMHADEIIVLEAGRITERGTHDELLAGGGTYARVYELQTRD
ncbi:MAG: ABC transporter ATP-binding protein [Eubacterium sp.]|nr:ABC transporter ATP-binding protein [Eubacterium sp.]